MGSARPERPPLQPTRVVVAAAKELAKSEKGKGGRGGQRRTEARSPRPQHSTVRWTARRHAWGEDEWSSLEVVLPDSRPDTRRADNQGVCTGSWSNSPVLGILYYRRVCPKVLACSPDHKLQQWISLLCCQLTRHRDVKKVVTRSGLDSHWASPNGRRAPCLAPCGHNSFQAAPVHQPWERWLLWLTPPRTLLTHGPSPAVAVGHGCDGDLT